MFINLHQHDDNSNGNMIECVSTYADYIQFAKEHNLPAVAITNHGNVVSWVKRKKAIEAAGLKYVHGIEAYVTDHIKDEYGEFAKIKDNYHTILIAKNKAGVDEINILSSKSYQHDGHFYYKPRITFDELANTSDNVYVTTACLGGAIWQTSLNGDQEQLRKWIDFIKKNKHRVFLEVQPHLVDDQRALNEILIALREETGARLIASNDVHAVNKRHNEIRQVLKKGKGIEFETDDDFDLWAKTEDEMRAQFKEQGVLEGVLLAEAFESTQMIVDSIEPFELDLSHKYPKMFKDSNGTFKKVVMQGIKDRGINKFPPEKQKIYLERINHELQTFAHNGSVDYMLADWAMLKAAREHGIHYGYGRGSVAGSLVAYLTHSTEVDPIKFNLDFERFMNKERISLADIDHDFAGPDKKWVQEWLLTNPDLHCASIMTANTFQAKGAIKALVGGLEPYNTFNNFQIQAICDKIGEDDVIPMELREKYPDLIEMAEDIIGVVSSFGRHAAGVVVSTDPIKASIGTMMVKGWDYPVTQLAMKDIDYMNFTKFDILGLDNMALISKTCELAGLPFLTPDSDIVDSQDEKVWKSMAEDNVAIFQFESARAGDILKHMFSDETMAKIKAKAPNIRYMDLLSLANAAQRPAGASYIENLTMGKFKDNGHEALNKFLESTLGNLVYQEQQTAFLVQYCLWSVGEADLIRRGIGKKNQQIMDTEVPKIKPAFIKTMIEKYGDTQEHAEQIADSFIQVFMDSVNYGFSVNHSTSYSWIGYISAWLRYYYPLEFCTAGLQVWSGTDKQDKSVKLMNFAESHGIKMASPKFGYSKGQYFFDKDTNTIYQGTAPVKGNNEETGDLLYGISKDSSYDTFVDLLMKIKENGYLNGESVSSVYLNNDEKQLKQLDKDRKDNPDGYKLIQKPTPINKTKIVGLIKLGYFEQFGPDKKLMHVYEFFEKNYKPNNKTFAGKAKKYIMCREFEKNEPDESYSFLEQCGNELNYTGRVTQIDTKIPSRYMFVIGFDKKKTRVNARFYSFSNGKTFTILVGTKLYDRVPFQEGDLVEISELSKTAKSVNVDGKWTRSKTEFDFWAKHMKFIRKGNKDAK
jgi:DNA polymerase-3 subunit alpha